MRTIYICQHQDCGRSYVNNSILKRHIQAFHNSEKKFQCSHCGKCLASRQNLKEHLYIHTGEKPYKCPYPGCTSTFRQGTHLSAHKRSEHSETHALVTTGVVEQYQIDLNYLTKLISKDEKYTLLPHILNTQTHELAQITSPYTCRLPNRFS